MAKSNKETKGTKEEIMSKFARPQPTNPGM